MSLEESKRIAKEMEEEAENQAREILAEAEAVVARNKLQISRAEEEMAVLNAEMEPPPSQPSKSLSVSLPQNIGSDNNSDINRDDPATQIVNGKYITNLPPSSYPTEGGTAMFSFPEDFAVPREAGSRPGYKNSVYDMKLVSFVNARHFVTFGPKPGPVHAHSWQVEVEVEVPPEVGDTVEFARVVKAVTSSLGVYENTVLNTIYPFNLIQPTTENIAMYFYNRVDEVLSELGLGLAQLNLWETPTRGIQVSNHNSSLDESIHKAQQLKEFNIAQDEAAAAQEVAFTEIEGLTQDEKKKKYIPRLAPPPFIGHLRSIYSRRQYIIAVLVILAFAVITYSGILWPPIEQRYPWGSDSWGHLFKAENLYQEILRGNYYPQFTEYWYNGSQPFRYWAPLPYYVLAILRAISGDIFTAGNLYIFLCALFGALSWLFLSRRMGLWPAVMAGLVWLFWQDNVRVAFSEGNVPRVLATALLPLLFALFLHILSKPKSYKGIIAAIIMLHLIVISHAMIAAIYCICLALFAFFVWVFQGCRLPDFVETLAVIIIGIGSASWWLLPSLTGGITGIDAQAVREVIQFVAARISLSPWYRFSNVETFYWGIALIIALLATMISWKSKPAWAKSAGVCGFILVLITFPIVRGVYINLPLSHLLWPLRFSSFAALAILAAFFTFNPAEQRQEWLKSPYTNGLFILILFVLLMSDCLVSFRLLAHTGTKPFDIIQSGDFIKQQPGWRVATIDLSQLGSAPSYAFSEIAGLEQVFGWAWQGAITSKNIMLLNTGLEHQYYPFLFRSCVDLGATDLVVKESVVTDLKAFRNAANLAGYTQRNKFAGISVWRNIGRPYLVEKSIRCLVIGKYGGTIALQFPEVEMGVSPNIDQYTLQELKKYSTIILSGSTWSSKSKAEKLIIDYAASGGKVYVELAGMPNNVLAKQPEFLGIFGEAVNTRGEVEVWGHDKKYVLNPVWDKNPNWRAYVPMGLDKVELEFSYYGNQAPIFGYKIINKQKIYFLGDNITYHAFQTGKSDSLKLVKDVLNLNTDYAGTSLIPLDSYEASEKGYQMSYHSSRAFEAIVPVSKIDGMKVKLDGKDLAAENYENLVQLKLPAGKHQIDIVLQKTPVYRWGALMSLMAMAFMAVLLFYIRKTGEAQ